MFIPTPWPVIWSYEIALGHILTWALGPKRSTLSHPLKMAACWISGRLRLGILETPGPTPAGISILVYDLAKDARHHDAALTGDTLFIGHATQPEAIRSQVAKSICCRSSGRRRLHHDPNLVVKANQKSRGDARCAREDRRTRQAPAYHAGKTTCLA